MRPYRIYLARITAVIAISLMFVGCTYTLKSNDVSVLETGSPLKSIPPKTFALKEFRDARGTVLSKSKGPYLFHQEGAFKCRLDQPAAAVVAMVIRKELERNGHRCVAYSAQSNPDFIVEGSVYKFQVIQRSHALDTEVAAKLTFSPVPPEKEVLIKDYEGRARYRGVYTFKTGVNRALLAMVKEMSTDPDLIAFLEK